MDTNELKVGNLYDVPSGMGGSFTVKLLSITESPERRAHLRVHMPRNRDWHGYVLTSKPEDLRPVRK
jgi:hypothetical protein